MARPLKTSLSYWSKDCDFYRNPTFRKVGRRCGAVGFAVLDCVLCKIFSHGYYIFFDNDLAEDLADESFTTPEAVLNTVRECAEIGIFDSELFTKKSILTALWMQQIYFSATARRQKPHSDLPYLISDSISADNNPINECVNGVTEDINSQNKRKENTNNTSSFIDKKTTEEIIQIFFLKNSQDPQSEYHKFVNHYALAHWKTKDGKTVTDVLGLARAWTPAVNEIGLGAKNLALLAELNNELNILGFDIDERKKLRNLKQIYYKDNEMYIDCDDSFFELIENHADKLVHIFRKYASRQHYNIHNENINKH